MCAIQGLYPFLQMDRQMTWRAGPNQLIFEAFFYSVRNTIYSLHETSYFFHLEILRNLRNIKIQLINNLKLYLNVSIYSL